MSKLYIKSPLNYVGGKYKILEQIIPKFPKKINTFVDLFGGGFNVGVNVNAETIIYNDVILPLCELMNYFSDNTSSEVIEKLENNININELNKENSEAFLKLRNKYNHTIYENEDERILDFYSLILYSFNYQIRFNQNMEYNTPFGKNRSSYNQNTKKNLKQFVDKINNINLEISKDKFINFDFSKLGKDDFVYCDPPYLITTGSYNDGNRGIKDWTIDDEKQLLNILDDLNSRGIKFALSNVLIANNKKNEVLTKWSEKYNVHIIKNTFDNSNYRRKNKKDTIEVLITNYEEEKMSSIELSTKYSSKRSFGWSQDASDFNSLKSVVQIFDSESEFHKSLITARIPMLVENSELVNKFQNILNAIPLKISYSDLVGTHSNPRKNSPCNGIIQASIRGQKKPYLTDWASDSYLRWAHLCGFIKYNNEDDTFEITEEGLTYSNTENESEEEKECLLNALLKYPPVSRILQLLSNGEHLSKFEIGSQLGFVGDEGFTSLPQNILLTSLAMTNDLKEKNEMKSDWDGSSDKYARQICKWLEKLGLIRQQEKEYKVLVGNTEFIEKLGQAYLITPEGLKAFRRVQGVNKVSKISKNVFWEMLCPKATDREYIRNRRAYIIKFLSDASGGITLDKIQEKLVEVKFDESLETIKDDIKGLQNIGLFIKESSKGYLLNDEINNLIIPINSIGTGKSDTLRLKDFCRDILEHISHNYLNLIDLAYEPKSNRQFEMEVVDLLVSECGYKGLHLGGGRKPDGIIYTDSLKNNYGTIIDTKAYSKGYSLPISQADEMRRYVEENNKRDKKINPNEWWNNFPKYLKKFSFLFVSSEFNGQFEEKLSNIAQTTNINGGAMNVVNLLLFAEKIKAQYMTLDEAYRLITQNSEINSIGV